jgi:aspartyl-tRNA(Asn)/glutamyl-tRNA(Gln) amidotransferase subunit A
MSDLPVPDYRQALDGNIRGTRVGVVKELLHSPVVDPEVREAVSLSANVLADLGASVEEISIPLAGNGGTIATALRVEAPITHRELVRNRLREIRHDNRIAYLTLSIIPAQAYYKAQKLRVMLRQQILETLDRVDVLLSPTIGVAAQKIEPDPVIDSKGKASRNPWFFTRVFSLANVPTVSVPCGFTSQNLPVGLQIAGRPFQDAAVLKVAHAYEQATTWHTRRPPI